MTSRTEHHLRPRRAPIVPGVRCPILGAAVGFRLRDDSRGDDPVNAGDQLSSEEVAGEGDDVVIVVIFFGKKQGGVRYSVFGVRCSAVWVLGFALMNTPSRFQVVLCLWSLAVYYPGFGCSTVKKRSEERFVQGSRYASAM